ncbi:tyrosine-protein phosphatase [Mucilaginibacter flavus]|uniref:tyrosine-protein phosphatase n=1 Tax=Mucilaginibacter flavus TaxID=931504 RepID=UPI0025B559DE|nr:tyrosine-protein phosphatase [Mucilaginibacter flavus]MDN3584438.1 tyrosine-protein phosphatase [Mucilaginibacter flavus]
MKFLSVLLLTVCVAGSTRAQIADSAKRKVDLKGAVNFRDLGGYTTTDGHHVKWGKVYRSADMSKLTDDDLAELQKRNIAYDVDLRGTQEAKQAPDRMNANTDYILCPAGSENVGNMMSGFKNVKGNGDSILINYYSNITPLADRYKPMFGKLLNLPADKSLVFHCTAGKDRTGIGAALLLYSLGVPYDTIMSDYEATNYYRATENEKTEKLMVRAMKIDETVAKNVMAAKKDYLDATFNEIIKKYGSIDNYLKIQIGLSDKDIKTLKKKYLD